MAKTVKVKAGAKSVAVEEQIFVPPIDLKTAKITLQGTTPLLVNRFDEKSKTEMLEKQMKGAKRAKEARDPKREYEASLYRMPGLKNKYGIPVGGVKNCAVSACRFIEGVPMTIAKGAFHVLDETGTGLLPIDGSDPTMDERICRIGPFGKKTAITRYRGRFDKWKVSFTVQYNARVISPAQLLNLYENAGFSIGLCEFRPEKSGSLGMFQVARKG